MRSWVSGRTWFAYGVLLAAFAVCMSVRGSYAQYSGVLRVPKQIVQVAPNPAYTALPLTIEVRVRLESKASYNVILANEDKPSATHWELFTTPGDGAFSTYLPGRRPDHVHSRTDIVDGKWHYLALILEKDRARLYVDGVMKADEAVTTSTSAGIPGPLVIGSLVTGQFETLGDIDEVRISNCVRDIAGIPSGEFTPDDSTVGLWHFNEAGRRFRDSSKSGNDAMALGSQNGESALGSPHPDSVFGGVLDARTSLVDIMPYEAFRTPPLSAEFWVRLDRTAQQQGTVSTLISNEFKSSGTHWELYTQGGILQASMPGCSPSFFTTRTNIADGDWHFVQMVWGKDSLQVAIDGEERLNGAVSQTVAHGTDSPLVIGGLPERGGPGLATIDELRLSKSTRPITKAPSAEFQADSSTIGLWHFNESGAARCQDDSQFHHISRMYSSRPPDTSGLAGVQGGEKYEAVRLPSPEDTTGLRQCVASLASRLGLATVDMRGVADDTIGSWIHDWTCYGKVDFEKQAREVWYGEDFLNPKAMREQAYDPQALILPADGGPAGTVLRRAQALVRELGRSRRVAASLASDLQRLQAAYRRENPAADSDEHRAYYLAACAIRRQLALSNPLLDFDSILCVARGSWEGSVHTTPMTNDIIGGHLSTQYFGFNALQAGGLYIIRDYKTRPQFVNVLERSVVQTGRLKGRRLDHGAFATPDLSFDGKRVVFAWCESPDHTWIYSRDRSFHLFSVNIDGSNLVQLTDGAYSDFDPCWLPNGRIAFVSERRGGYIRCFAAGMRVRNYTLLSMKDDGNDIVPLSYYETAEWNPTVTNDGRIAYTRWDYTDRENCLGTRLWICGPDGTDPRATHGNYPLPWHNFAEQDIPGGDRKDTRLGSPLVEMGIRAVPGSPLFVATGAPHHGEVYGSLCMIDLRKEDDGHMSQVKRLTPDEPFPETETYARRHYKYGTPWPLSADFFLCNRWEDLILLDRYGNQELICSLRALPGTPDARLRLVDPIPVKRRPVPPVLPTRTYQGERANPATKASVAVMNVYDSDMKFPPGTKIKWLRVVQGILKTNHAMGVPMIGYQNENTPRVPLGVVPVEEDGSVYFEAPVAKQLIFQALDQNHMAVQTMRSTTFVHPGEQLTCMGCHERPRKAPVTSHMPRALRRQPSKLQAEIGAVEPISYYRQIKPIVGNKCIACHGQTAANPLDLSYEALSKWIYWFSGGMWSSSMLNGTGGGSRSIPGRVGARGSKLSAILMDANHRAAVSDADRRVFTVWLDCNAPRLGSYVRVGDQMKGELVWPTLDVDPMNILGIEGQQPSLVRSFWHENTWGPHVFLGTSHTLGKIYVMDQNQRIIWDYEVPNPQDVWKLPNGNVLTTYLHGVKEITPDKRVVWEYKVDAPNEVPTCQPLSDGNVLIGVVGLCQLIEVNRQGEVVHRIQLSTTEQAPHAQFRMCRKTSEGTYLVPFSAEGIVREYDRNGRVIRYFPPAPFPVCALRLTDGHTLITADKRVIEYDEDGHPVWQLSQNDVPDINIGILAGVQRLPNGNTVVCNWGTSSSGNLAGAHIFEVDEEKRVVWQVESPMIGGVAQCQLLTGDGKPRTDGISR